MADRDEHLVSSSTHMLPEELHHYEAEPEFEPEPEAEPEPVPVPEPVPEPRHDLFSVDDIVDLVGGAQDALERHIAEDSAPHDFTETLVEEPVTVPEPDPEAEPEPEPEPEPAVPDTSAAPAPSSAPAVPEEPAVVAPKAEPESTKISAPAPHSDALPAADARTAAEAPAEAAEQRAVTEEAAAPASCLLHGWKLNMDARDVPSSSKAPLQPLMQFPTALGQKGDFPAPISPLSPLHSPDSLEELSLTESPNQPPASGSAAPLGSFSTQPSATQSKDMPWGGEEGDPGPGRSKKQEALLDPLAGPYLSLGKDPGPHNPCEDSGVSFSPEEKLLSSDRSSGGPSPVNPQTKVPESHLASSNPTEHWDSALLASQDNSKASMDSFGKNPSGYEADLRSDHSDEDEDLMYEVKKNNNPFEGFSPLADSGYSHFGDSKSDSRASKMSESPTPDLVQYGQTGESPDSPPSFLDEGKALGTGKTATDVPMPSLKFSSGPKAEDDEEEEEEDSALPPSLPDILKSSPLNPEKIDSGSSEGSPEEQSPILERRMMESPNPPINLSANNPFAFDAKVSLLKEMTEEMEVKAADKGKPEDEKIFGAFDLVKEAKETSPMMKAKEEEEEEEEEEPVKIEQKDWFSSHDSPKKAQKFQPLDFKSKKTPAEDSDSESPTADSLSPVLEAMAKNPASFQVEPEKDQKVELEEPEVAEEVSEHEVSSEEFEFIERPPRGVIDEFLEALDTSKFASSKPPEIPLDEDVAPPPAVKEEPPSQSSRPFLPQASPLNSKAELEKLDLKQAPPPAPLAHSPVRKPEVAPAAAKKSAGSVWKLPKLNVNQVVDLLYWRDVKTTGVVFGAALLLLLSLTVCSIVSVCSYIGLALLSVTICFRIYKGILQAIQKSDDGHPFKQYLDQEVALSEDTVHQYSDVVLAKLNKTIGDLRRVFLVEDLVDSIKFAVLMWILTYVGALFNGLTLLILGVIAAFSCPIVYEKHQAQIDHYVSLVNNQVKDVVGKIQAKVPGMKRKTE